ncbi:hypothetical protein [Azospirillum picis]|uniref:Uncharacterized protein n=1 Tax=Azospirillum picis TaxID=488438 RepID=A0ABU0MKE6_9PROT|nr:hypothetical protein [Azospirillum picis]MBP2300076.1 hypothetical protein [Azospirillum picis]MDQ0533686.1 hypothetical protein [Azospirillum picis]
MNNRQGNATAVRVPCSLPLRRGGARPAAVDGHRRPARCGRPGAAVPATALLLPAPLIPAVMPVGLPSTGLWHRMMEHWLAAPSRTDGAHPSAPHPSVP